MPESPQKKLLLHVCCAPCSTHSIERMQKEWQVVLFFSNSNIAPEAEYRRRLAAAEHIAAIYDCRLIGDEYDHAAWLDFIKGLEAEPEKGTRCLKCFEYNLQRTAARADQEKCDAFTTTLTISPHKDFVAIAAIGSGFAKFVPVNFKKMDGFRRSLELSRVHGLYRQDYCGCEFSLRS